MPYQHILVAVDLTDECDPVMKRAAALATSNQARLSVVHVVEPMAMAFGGDVPMDLSMLQQQQFDQARERLDAFAVRYPDLGSEQRHLVWATAPGNPPPRRGTGLRPDRGRQPRSPRPGAAARFHCQRRAARRALRRCSRCT